MNHIEIKAMPQLSYAQNESINLLATNLSYCGTDSRGVLITSRTAREGKSFVAINLMRTMASLGYKVLLLDTDLRRSVLATRYQFEATSDLGLTDYLAGVCGIEDVVCTTNIENAYLVRRGRAVENSLQLLVSPRLKELMDYLYTEFDYIIVDSAPTGLISDGLEIARYCQGALIVVGYNVGHKKEIIELADSIQHTGCPVLGVVLNQVETDKLINRRYYYSYGKYDSYYKNDDESGKKRGKKKK